MCKYADVQMEMQGKTGVGDLFPCVTLCAFMLWGYTGVMPGLCRGCTGVVPTLCRNGTVVALWGTRTGKHGANTPHHIRVIDV